MSLKTLDKRLATIEDSECERLVTQFIDELETVLSIDEIERFQSGRWVSPLEAVWRIFAFDLYDMQPAVMPLQMHLPTRKVFALEIMKNLSMLYIVNRGRKHL